MSISFRFQSMFRFLLLFTFFEILSLPLYAMWQEIPTEEDQQLPQKAPVKILCMDGEGLRGLRTIMLLKKLEKELGSPIINNFDLMVGEGTAGLTVLALNRERSVDDILTYYDEYGPSLFAPTYFRSTFMTAVRTFYGEWGHLYDATALTILLERMFGETTMENAKKPVFVTFRHSKTRKIGFMNNTENDLTPMKIAGRACTAVSCYFPEVSILQKNETSINQKSELQEFHLVSPSPSGTTEEFTPATLYKQGIYQAHELSPNQSTVLVSIGIAKPNPKSTPKTFFVTNPNYDSCIGNTVLSKGPLKEGALNYFVRLEFSNLPGGTYEDSDPTLAKLLQNTLELESSKLAKTDDFQKLVKLLKQQTSS